MFRIETERLIISEFSLQDAPFILDITNTPGWLTFIGDRNIHSIEDAENYISSDPIPSYEAFGFGLFKVSIKHSDETIGICGFKKRQELDYPDLGYAFLPEFEGKGYAFESALSLLHWASSTIQYSKVLAITLKENQRSVALLTRLGFKVHSEYESEGEILNRYEFEF